MARPCHLCYLCYSLQGLEEEAVLWELTSESEPRDPTALCIRVLCEVEPLSNHEEQLSCPASWCAHGSAAVSGLLRHQMAVSILRGAAIAFFRPVTIFYATLPSDNVKTDGVLKLHGIVRLWGFVEWRARGSFEKGPSIPRVAPDRGRGRVFSTRVSDEGDNRLVLHVMNGNLLCFNVAPAKWVSQLQYLSSNVPLLYNKKSIRIEKKIEMTRRRVRADSDVTAYCV